MKKLQNQKQQQGMATLIVAIIVLVITTMMVLYAARVGVMDFRMAGNESRHKEAFAMADAGLDFSTQRFVQQFKANFDANANAATVTANVNTIMTNASVAGHTTTTGAAAAAGTPYFTVTVANGAAVSCTPPIPAACMLLSDGTYYAVPSFIFTSTGVTGDGTGTSTVRREIKMVSALAGDPPDVPVIVDGTVGAGGDFSIVTNPNAAGPGAAVSVWSSGEVDMQGSPATCHPQYYDGNNPQCPNPSLATNKISSGSMPINAATGDTDGNGKLDTYVIGDNYFDDILPNAPDFPDDLFAFLFGISRADWITKYDEADQNGQVKTSCSGLNANSGEKYPIWWITGPCDVNTTIGSESNPVILVIDNAALTMTGGTPKVYGIVYIFDNPDKANTAGNPPSPGGQLSGTVAIYGALISDVGGSAMQGSYSVVYRPTLMGNLGGANGRNYSVAYVPGSWRDF